MYLLVLLAITPNQIQLTLDDGSTIRAALVTPSITVETKYGSLIIPAEDINTITFGLHNSPDDDKVIETAAKKLGSDVYRERVSAQETLVSIGRRAIPILLLCMKSQDQEIAKSSKIAWQKIIDKDAREAAVDDRISTKYFNITGKIREGNLQYKSNVLGDLTIPLRDSIKIVNVIGSGKSYVIDASNESWFPTGMKGNLRINASGTVDLWSMTPGQYTTGPKGHTTMGKGGQYPAGALIGKSGDRIFLIGESAVISCDNELFLQVVQSSWNNLSVGRYTVTIIVE